MSDYENFLRRAKNSTVDGLKDATFKRRLKRDYNSEDIEVNDVPLKAVIQTSRLSESADYKKISLNLNTEVRAGDLIYWNRLDSHWLIFLQRTTEKTYFLGEMQLAKYKIHWRDEYGNEFSQYGCLRRKSSDIVNYHSYFDAYSEADQLLLPLTKETRILKRYDKIKLSNTTYSIRGIDDINRENLIVFYLERTDSNGTYDTETLPYGKIEINSEIYTNLDNVKEVSLGSTIELVPSLSVNSKDTEETFIVECENCNYENGVLTFNALGAASIKIKANKSRLEKTLELAVLENIISTIDYLIEGNEKVRAMLSYTYNIKININGTLSSTIGEWSIDNPNLAKIISTTQDSCAVKIGKLTGKFNLSCKINEEKTIIKEIEISSLL